MHTSIIQRARVINSGFGGLAPKSNPSSLVLDGVANVLAAFSLRKLRTAYAGKAANIRESGGNTLQDIGFVGQNFDAVAFTTFVGGGSGFVKKCYDQSGVGVQDAVQTTNASQPGVNLTGLNSQPTLTWAGAQALVSTLSAGPTTTLSAFIVVDHPSGGAGYFELSPAGSVNTGMAMFDLGSFTLRCSVNGGSDASKADSAGFHQLMGFWNTSFNRVVVDGVTGTDGSGNTSLPASTHLDIGSLGSSNFPIVGNIAEMIFINADLSGVNVTAAAIRADQKAYWGTP